MRQEARGKRQEAGGRRQEEKDGLVAFMDIHVKS